MEYMAFGFILSAIIAIGFYLWLFTKSGKKWLRDL